MSYRYHLTPKSHPAAKAVLTVAGAQVILGGIVGAELVHATLVSTPNGYYTFTGAILNKQFTVPSMASGTGQAGNAIGRILF